MGVAIYEQARRRVHTLARQVIGAQVENEKLQRKLESRDRRMATVLELLEAAEGTQLFVHGDCLCWLCRAKRILRPEVE